MKSDEEKKDIPVFIDYREDHSLKLIRILNIVEKLAYNRNGKKALTIEGASFIDYLYENQSLIPHVLDYFNRDYSWLSVNSTLYDSSIDTTDTYRNSDFRKIVIELINKGLINLEEINGSYYITPNSEQSFRINDDQQKKWDLLSQKLKFLLSKPQSTLFKSMPGHLI